MNEFQEDAIVSGLQTNNNTNEHSSKNGNGGVEWTAGVIILSLFLFIVAGIFEIGGGYLMWLGIREKRKPAIFIPVGAVVLIAYGVIPTLQPMNSFGRVFAVYGGFFIVLSYLWAAVFDNFKPDKGDYIGSAIAIVGVCVAWFWPR